MTSELLGRAATPGGAEMLLIRHDDDYIIVVGGRPVMSSGRHRSEDALATVACAAIRGRARPRVLIGGLGLGFTLRAALDALPPEAGVLVAELVPEVIAWNRGLLASVAGHPLQDPRVVVEACDVRDRMREHHGPFDAILLDVDNGPQSLTTPANAALYDDAGLADAHAALTAGGVLAVWSARADGALESRLRARGFAVRVERVGEDVIYVGGRGES